MSFKKVVLLLLVNIFIIACVEKSENNLELAKTLVEEGLSFLQEDNLDKAILKFEEAILADSSLEDSYAYLIQIYLTREEYLKAQQYTEKALKVSPNVGENWVLGGIFHDKQGNAEKAKKYYLTSIEKFEALKKANIDSAKEEGFGFDLNGITEEDINIVFSYILLDNKDRVESLVIEMQEKDPKNPMYSQLLSFDREIYLESVFQNME